MKNTKQLFPLKKGKILFHSLELQEKYKELVKINHIRGFKDEDNVDDILNYYLDIKVKNGETTTFIYPNIKDRDDDCKLFNSLLKK